MARERVEDEAEGLFGGRAAAHGGAEEVGGMVLAGTAVALSRGLGGWAGGGPRVCSRTCCTLGYLLSGRGAGCEHCEKCGRGGTASGLEGHVRHVRCDGHGRSRRSRTPSGRRAAVRKSYQFPMSTRRPTPSVALRGSGHARRLRGAHAPRCTLPPFGLPNASPTSGRARLGEPSALGLDSSENRYHSDLRSNS